MAYQVVFEKTALKAIQKLDKSIQIAVINAIENLANNPRPNGYIKLTGRLAYRIRVGNYRVIYNINDKQVTVLILEIGHRKEIYK